MLKHTKNWWAHKNTPAARTAFYAYVVLLFIATLIPSDSIPSGSDSWFSIFKFNHSDKIVHFIMFFGLTLLLYFAYNSFKKIGYITIPVTMGIVIEILQHLMGSGRTFDIWDIAANTMGTLTAFLLLHKFQNPNSTSH